MVYVSTASEQNKPLSAVFFVKYSWVIFCLWSITIKWASLNNEVTPKIISMDTNK